MSSLLVVASCLYFSSSVGGVELQELLWRKTRSLDEDNHASSSGCCALVHQYRLAYIELGEGVDIASCHLYVNVSVGINKVTSVRGYNR